MRTGIDSLTINTYIYSMSKILQISDIHINGEYDGLFDVKKHFKQILDDAVLTDFDAIALTGDIVDNGTVEEYTEVFRQIEQTFGEEIPILAIPGNHDNRQNFDFAYIDYISRLHNFKRGVSLRRIGGTFEEPGKCVVILTLDENSHFIGNHKLIGMDNAHKDLPHEGLEALMMDDDWFNRDKYSYYLFVHMPLIKPFHRFMNVDEHSIREDAAKTFLLAMTPYNFRGIFCGHYHCASMDSYADLVQYTAPASQCQLDRFSKDCTPSGNYPGYAIINLDAREANMVKVKYITDDTKPEDENGK